MVPCRETESRVLVRTTACEPPIDLRIERLIEITEGNGGSDSLDNFRGRTGTQVWEIPKLVFQDQAVFR